MYSEIEYLIKWNDEILGIPFRNVAVSQAGSSLLAYALTRSGRYSIETVKASPQSPKSILMEKDYAYA